MLYYKETGYVKELKKHTEKKPVCATSLGAQGKVTNQERVHVAM